MKARLLLPRKTWAGTREDRKRPSVKVSSLHFSNG